MRRIQFIFLILLFSSCSMRSSNDDNTKNNNMTIYRIDDTHSEIGRKESGKKEGDWIYTKNNKCVKIIRFSDDLKNGISRSFHKNGNIKVSIHYKDDRINGMVNFHNEKGVLLAIYKFVYDKLDEIEYYKADPESPPKDKTFFPSLD